MHFLNEYYQINLLKKLIGQEYIGFDLEWRPQVH
jgi:hypothetical protein